MGDLLFVEVVGGQIVGIGHHFRHRRLYRDSIHLKGDPDLEAKDRLRVILCPPALERKTEPDGPYAGAPQKLTAARGLFGYVAQEYDAENPNEPLTFGIGATDSDFKQLAGRISINWAVEQPRSSGSRFLHEKSGECLAPLRPLGEPKPSAVETYLTQEQKRLDKRSDLGTLCTYGDTTGDESAGELNGRKFYLHQPNAANSVEQHFELHPNNPDWSHVDSHGHTTYHIAEDQAILARFVSTPRSQFKFTLRFRDLRSWELGALFIVLGADRKLIDHLLDMLDLKENPPERLRRWLARVPNWEERAPGTPLLAMKLGHGRPLGMGSVRICIDSIRRLRFDDEMIPSPEDHVGKAAVRKIQEETVGEFAAKLQNDESTGKKLASWIEDVFLPWLQVHRYAGRTSYDYPRGKDGKAKRGLIYEYHSNQRQKHAWGRKLPKPPQPLTPGGLMSLDDLDKRDLMT
ncbi:MAG: hypothetical protein ACC645_05370 [Pirellulales bacterium]